MPIILDDVASGAGASGAVAATPQKRTYSPTYFSKKLTGSYTSTGAIRKTGVLSEDADPASVKPGVRKLVPGDIDVYHRTVHNKGVTSYQLPIELLTSDFWRAIEHVPMADTKDGILLVDEVMTQARTGHKVPVKVFLTLDVHSIVLDEEKIPHGGMARNLRSVWRCMLWVNPTGTHADADVECTILDFNSSLPRFLNGITRLRDNTVLMGFDSDIAGVIHTLKTGLVNNGFSIDESTIDDAFSAVHTLDSVSRAANRWQTEIDKVVMFAVERLQDAGVSDDELISVVSQLMHRLEGYQVSLGFYRPIYDMLANKVAPEILQELVKTNLNLLLTNTMQELADVKPQLNRCPMNPAAKVDPFFNSEQSVAIGSHDPLVMIQASAGTGKSSTIRGRINYMIDSGIEPHDITVLSFTNAAADHIKDICPGVNSMTIASMVHSIYSENFQHELSSISTLINSLDIWYPRNALAGSFKHFLRNVDNSETDAFTQLNSFVEDNYERIVEMLDTCQQTTLELEIIMCYQHIGDYIEPPEVASKHLIVDEVQDNSIFDFVYILEYCVKHLESLYIVGDASQTLYEFRAANPRALNIMEASGVFSTYKLQINYRSNQNILDFANIGLADIEANQFANLRLRSNDLTPVTLASFKKCVQITDVYVSKQVEFAQNAINYTTMYLKPYIDDCLSKGEHVCLLAYSRREVDAFKAAFEIVYPDKTIENLSPQKAYDTTVLSTYICREWNQIRMFDRHLIVSQLHRYIEENVQSYTFPRKGPAYNAALNQLDKWADAARPVVQQWNVAVDSGRITDDEFYDKLREHMIDFEIRSNAINQNIQSQKNRERRENIDFENTDILLSTIHSAKGLEFENVIVVYRDYMNPAEDIKRMYYVALTRAMKTEHILAWSTSPTEKAIVESYNNVLHTLSEAEKAAKKAAMFGGDTTSPVDATDASNEDDTSA